MRVVLDVETTFQTTDKGTDPSPYNHANSLVTLGYHIIDTNETGYIFLNHKTRKDKDAAQQIQAVLDKATCIIGHNLKFDMSWLYECGYKYEGKMYDTMLFEYAASKGRRLSLKLSECAVRYGLTEKLDIFKQRMSEGLNTDEMDAGELEDYGLGDIQTTLELYNIQRLRYKDEADIRTMWPVISLANESMQVLIDMERAGITIDVTELDRVEHIYRTRKAELEGKLESMVRSVMGDTPVNLNSPEDLCAVVYSMRITDKTLWAEELNIGSELRGSVKKKKYLRRKTDKELRSLMSKCFEKVYRTDKHQCGSCKGSGKQYIINKDGTPRKKQPKCKTCDGEGVVYVPNGRRGGFGVKPISYEYASSGGFSADKETITDLISSHNITEEAQLFLESYSELSAIDVYLTSFVEGIRKSIRSDGKCHPNFNQAVTATGRLSSSGPNWQNQPREGTFPIKRCVVPTHKDGFILEADFAALEYRAAVALADCPAGIESLRLGKDRHQLTAEIVFNIRKEEVTPSAWKEYRQKAKSRTFRPLYGGTSGTEREMAYNEAFFVEHVGISAWHVKLCEEAINKKQITTPSGRIFAFPEAARKSNGSVTSKTQIVNYPVQSFASADIAWCVFIYLHNKMKELKLKSRLILQVHDSISADVHPDEKETVLELFRESFGKCNELLKDRFNFVSPVEFTYEMAIGKNALDKEQIA